MANCCEDFKGQFKAKKLLLQHCNPQTFVQFQCGYQKLYLAWRLFWALYHVAWIIVTGVDSDRWAGPDPAQRVKWFIYLTDWAYFLLTTATLVDATVILYVFVKRTDIRKGHSTSMPWYMQMDWCLFVMANGISVTMSATYWGLVFDDDPMTAVNIASHILNSVYVIVNILVTGTPTRLLHFWYPIVFGLVYILFTLFYYLAGGTNIINKAYIYSVLDWTKPGMTIGYAVVVAFVAVPVVHAILFGFHCLKLFVHRKCCNSDLGDRHETEMTFDGKPAKYDNSGYL